MSPKEEVNGLGTDRWILRVARQKSGQFSPSFLHLPFNFQKLLVVSLVSLPLLAGLCIFFMFVEILVRSKG
jgi:hypothetical protein